LLLFWLLSASLRPDRDAWTSARPSASTLTSSAELKRLRESFHGNCPWRGWAPLGRTAAVPPSSKQTSPSPPATASTEQLLLQFESSQDSTCDLTKPTLRFPVTSSTIHESYGIGAWTFPHDIAVVALTDAFALSATVTRVVLPLDNVDQFVGTTCTLSGWGRTSASNILPDALQKVDIPVISTADCNTLMAPVSGAACDDTQIAVYDAAGATGSCNGDSGGPMNCPSAGTTVVAGVTSWGISGGGACMPSYPSVYTRTSSYLGWIDANTGVVAP